MFWEWHWVVKIVLCVLGAGALLICIGSPKRKHEIDEVAARYAKEE